MTRWYISVAVLLYLMICTKGAELPAGEKHPPSPCPTVFQYENDTARSSQWNGIIHMELYKNKHLSLTVKLDRKANVGTSSGTVSSKDNQVFVIKYPPSDKPSNKQRFYVHFPPETPVPRVVGIWKDDQLVCAQVAETVLYRIVPTVPKSSTVGPTRPPTRPPSVIRTSTKGPTLVRPGTRPPAAVSQSKLTLKKTPTINSTVLLQNTTMKPKLETQNKICDEQCGTRKSRAVPLLLNAQNTYQGEWPWHAALYSIDEGTTRYTCGGTLVSRRTIITAGHCITNIANGRTVDTSSIVIYLGKFHLNHGWNNEDGVQTVTPEKFIAHPTYNAANLVGDIGLIILKQNVEITSSVRPACLWKTQELDVRTYEEVLGTVVGWGFDSRDKVSTQLQKVELPIKSFQTCIENDRDFFSHYLVDKTFCAGYKNGTSPCNGDSGGGMVLEINGRWHLRGIVSNGAPRDGAKRPLFCSSHHYTIFVDVAQYRDWIVLKAPELQT